MTVLVSQQAAAGSYRIGLTATSMENPARQGTAHGEVEVRPVDGFILRSAIDKRAYPGGEAVHLVAIRNTGNVQDSYRIEVRPSPSWTGRVSQTDPVVLPGAEHELEITLQIPRTASPGRAYRVRVDVVSQADALTRKTHWIREVVSPPPAHEVPQNLYPEIPLTMQVALSDLGDPQLRLSAAGVVPDVGRLNVLRSLGLSGTTSRSFGFHLTEWGVRLGNRLLDGRVPWCVWRRSSCTVDTPDEPSLRGDSCRRPERVLGNVGGS